MYCVVANSGSDKDLYAMKGEGSLGLRHRELRLRHTVSFKNVVQNLYAYDLFAIELSVSDVRLMKEGPVVSRVAVDTGSVENLYVMKVKAHLRLRRRRAPIPPRRLLQKRVAKPVRLCLSFTMNLFTVALFVAICASRPVRAT